MHNHGKQVLKDQLNTCKIEHLGSVQDRESDKVEARCLKGGHTALNLVSCHFKNLLGLGLISTWVTVA